MELDQELIAIAKGDIQALGRVYAALRVPVYASVLAIVSERALAEDALQESFIKVYSKAATYAPGSRPLAWVLTIARNTAYDVLRRRRRETPGAWPPEPSAPSTDQAEHIALINALLQLEPAAREIVVLHDVAGLTHAEIAAELQVPQGTVRWKYRRAIATLKRLLEGDADVAAEP